MPVRSLISFLLVCAMFTTQHLSALAPRCALHSSNNCLISGPTTDESILGQHSSHHHAGHNCTHHHHHHDNTLLTPSTSSVEETSSLKEFATKMTTLYREKGKVFASVMKHPITLVILFVTVFVIETIVHSIHAIPENVLITLGAIFMPLAIVYALPHLKKGGKLIFYDIWDKIAHDQSVTTIAITPIIKAFTILVLGSIAFASFFLEDLHFTFVSLSTMLILLKLVEVIKARTKKSFFNMDSPPPPLPVQRVSLYESGQDPISAQEISIQALEQLLEDPRTESKDIILIADKREDLLIPDIEGTLIRTSIDRSLNKTSVAIKDTVLTGEIRYSDYTHGTRIYGGMYLRAGESMVVRVVRAGTKTAAHVRRQSLHIPHKQKVSPLERSLKALPFVFIALIAIGFVIASIVTRDVVYSLGAVLITVCPCPFMILYPLTTAMFKRSVRERKFAYLKQGLTHHADVYIFDKTGTITESKLKLLDEVKLVGSFQENEVLAWKLLGFSQQFQDYANRYTDAILQTVSRHSDGTPLPNHFNQPMVHVPVGHNGWHIYTENSDDLSLFVGSPQAFLDSPLAQHWQAEMTEELAHLHNQPGIPVVLATETGYAIFKVDSPLKKDVEKQIRKLTKRFYHHKLAIVASGGDYNSLNSLAPSVPSVDLWVHSMTPQQKASLTKKLKNTNFTKQLLYTLKKNPNKKVYSYQEILPYVENFVAPSTTKNNVMFIGDGANDYLALQKATVGVSFQSAAVAAISSADIVVANEDNFIKDIRYILKRSLGSRIVFFTLFIFLGILGTVVSFVLILEFEVKEYILGIIHAFNTLCSLFATILLLCNKRKRFLKSLFWDRKNTPANTNEDSHNYDSLAPTPVGSRTGTLRSEGNLSISPIPIPTTVRDPYTGRRRTEAVIAINDLHAISNTSHTPDSSTHDHADDCSCCGAAGFDHSPPPLEQPSAITRIPNVERVSMATQTILHSRDIQLSA